MGEQLKKILLEAKKKDDKKAEKKDSKKKNGNGSKKSGKMLKKLHDLDDQIEDFVDSLEDEIMNTEDNPMFIKKANQLLADMSKEYSEFIMALRAIVNAVDRKGKILPAFDKQESRVRDVLDGNEGPPPEGEEELPPEGEEEEAPPEEEGADDEFELKVAKKGKGKKPPKKKGVKEALMLEMDMTPKQEKKALKEMREWFKDIKKRISQAEPVVKKDAIDQKVVDAVMRCAKVDEEFFFRFFWS